MYRLHTLFILILLTGCYSLSEIEGDIVGTWRWDETSGAFTEKGFVTLKKNRKNSYKIVGINPTERIERIKPELDGYWFLSKENNVCIAVEWSKPPIFSKAKVIRSDCLWFVRYNKVGKIELVLKNSDISFLSKEIVADRE